MKQADESSSIQEQPYRYAGDGRQAETRLQRRVTASVVIAISVTVLLGLFSWSMARLASRDADRVSQTYGAMRRLQLALRHADDVETGVRGFALTGAEQFLEPYETGRKAAARDQEQLALLITKTPDQQQRLQTLSGLTQLRLTLAAELVAKRRRSDKIPSFAELLQGKQTMDTMRATVRALNSEEQRLLDQRVKRSQRRRTITSLAIGLGGCAGIVFLCGAGVMIRRRIAEAFAAQSEIQALNAGLEQRVEERTGALMAEAAIRLQTEERLRSSEETFRALLNGIQDYAIYMLDTEGCVATWNVGAARITGYTSEEIIGKHVFCFFPVAKANQQHGQDGLQKAILNGRSEEEAIRVRKDGSTFWSHAVITSLYDASGSLRGFSKVMRDVTARKQTDELLRKQATLLELAHDAIIVRDLESRIVFWNRGAQQTYGWSAEEAVGQSVHALLGTVFPVPLSSIEQALTNKGQWEGELRHKTRSGAEIVVTSRMSQQQDESAGAAATMEINRDITDRKQAEEIRERMAAIVNYSTDAIMSKALDGTVTDWNQGAEKLFGYRAEEVVGKPPSMTMAQGAAAGELLTIDRIVRGELVENFETLWPRKDGTSVYVSIAFSPIRNSAGDIVGVSKVARDITQTKAAQEEIRKLNEDLEERIALRTTELQMANKELQAFTYSVSHDLRAPLRHITGFARILLSDHASALAPAAQSHLQRIVDAVARMGQLIDGLLGLAKLGRQPLKMQTNPMKTLVEQVIAILQPECEGRAVEWRVGDLPALECDRVLMGQVFQNLLSNALKYSRGRTPAVIEVESFQPAALPPVFFVRDNGAGFDMRYAGKLFEVFQRMHTESEFEGTGVGLATVYRIIHKHGGRIWAEAEVDRGATFFFSLGGQEQSRPA